MNKKVTLLVIVVLLTATLMACQLSGLVPTTTAPTAHHVHGLTGRCRP